MYRLYGGDSVRVKQAQRGAAVTLDAGTSALRRTKAKYHNESVNARSKYMCKYRAWACHAVFLPPIA